MKNGLIITHAMSSDEFSDMLRLSHQRHAAYARAFGFDFWAIYGDVATEHVEYQRGGWSKIELVRRGLAQGYQDVVWLDADAAIVNGQVDLRDALKQTGGLIGCVRHYAPWFAAQGIPEHYNSGVMYFKSDPLTMAFIQEWAGTYETAIKDRWLEQGAFNRLITEKGYQGAFTEVPARWNATVNVNPAPDEVVRGWHGVQPYARRLDMMRQTLRDDWWKFRV